MQRIIEQTQDGSATLYVPQLDEHYHSVKGARTESQHIFIEMGLHASPVPHPQVLEVGLGTGLNALLTLEDADRCQRPVSYTALELYPLSWDEVHPLGYSDNPLFEQLHLVPWQQPVQLTPYFSLRKLQGDAYCLLSEASEPDTSSPENSSFLIPNSSLFDVVYFDAFAPEKQPEMWTPELFQAIYRHMAPGGILTTYCAKGVVRRLLQATGFHVERLPGPPGGKREILRATKVSG